MTTPASHLSPVYAYDTERAFRGLQISVDNQHATLLVTAAEFAASKGSGFANYASGLTSWHIPVASYGHVTSGVLYPTWGHVGNGERIGGIVVAFGEPGSTPNIDAPVYDITSVYPETTSKTMTVLLSEAGLDMAIFKYTGTAPNPLYTKDSSKSTGLPGRVVGSSVKGSVRIAASDPEFDIGLKVVAVDTVNNLVAVYI